MNDTDSEIVKVMECMPYGLYIIGSTGTDGPNGMMGDWITQVSFHPRLISAAIENDAQTLANIRASGVFTLNFLSEGSSGMNLARQFAAPYNASKIGGPTALGVRPKLPANLYRPSGRGAPILLASMAWLECEAIQFVPVGDHTLVIGQVNEGRMQAENSPLTSNYTGWTYSG